MSGEFNNEKAIFLAALEKATPEQWPAFLDSACGEDANLRLGVERLLAAQIEMGSFHEARRPGVETTFREPIREAPGTVIGPFKLLEQIGEGGFAVVFMAEQVEPVRRKVALKILKPGMDTRHVVARFEAERQALAIMDHPHIAKVFDGGATPAGRPFFVMELVKGMPITEYCDQNHCSPRQRLELFIDVCQAVQHAHQKGIIHRDLKPSNVLVTVHDTEPVVKVIDFGIAKALGQELTEKTLFTGFAQMIGTPLYMSPEQAGQSGLDIDTRSDIYSLGVLLYELLTGTTPFDKERFRQATHEEIRRIIRDEEPPTPSKRLSELGRTGETRQYASDATRAAGQSKGASNAFQGRGDSRRKNQALRSELDWIVMKTLEKDRGRRYETAAGLAEDVQRYLDDEPIQACPPSTWYRAHKFVRRNRRAVGAATVVIFALLVGIAGASWGYANAEQRRSEAESAREREAKHRDVAVGNLYDSLVGEARAIRLAREVGFREKVWQRLRQAAALDTPKRDLNQLQYEAAACLGDFIGLEPVFLKDFGDLQIHALATNPKRPEFLIGFNDGSLSVRRLPSGVETSRWIAHPQADIGSVAYSSDGNLMVSAATDGSVILWRHVENGGWDQQWRGAIPPPPKGQTDRGIFTAVSPDASSVLAYATGTTSITSFNTSTGEVEKRLENTEGLGQGLAIDPHGSFLAAGTTKNGVHQVFIWDLSQGMIVETLATNLGAVHKLTFSPDGKYLALGCSAGIAAYDASTFQRQLYLPGGGGVPSIAIDRDSQTLAFNDGNKIRLWNLRTNREFAVLSHDGTPRNEGLSGWVYEIDIAHDEKTLVSASRASVALWQMAGASERVVLHRFAGAIPSVEFQWHGNLFACASKDKSVTVWDATTGQLVHNLVGCKAEVNTVAFSRDDRWVAAGDWSGGESVFIWDVTSGECLVSFDPEFSEVWSLDFSPNGQYLAVGGVEGWKLCKIIKDATDNRLRLEVKDSVRTSTVMRLCFLPDADLLAWLERNGNFHLWDVGAARERRSPFEKLIDMGSYVSPFGSKIAGNWLWIATPESAQVWDFTTMRPVKADYEVREVEIIPWSLRGGWCYRISPNGTHWVVGYGDGTLELWDLKKVATLMKETGLGWTSTWESLPKQN